jgi:TolB-like protein
MLMLILLLNIEAANTGSWAYLSSACASVQFYLQQILYRGTGFLVLLATLGLHAKIPSGPLIKRKVLILDFVNKNKEDHVNGYLVETIPDAIIDPLNDTKTFELMPRDKSREIMKISGLTTDDLANETTALDIARKSGAQVVVLGSFLVSKNEMVFQARALEVASGRLAVSKSQRGKISGNMFDLIGQLAKDLAKDMKNELPPVPQERIVEQIVVGKTITISVLDLESNGAPEPLGKLAADNLREALFRQKLYRLIEQERVRQALQKAGHSAAEIDSQKAAAMGLVLSSDKVVIGRVSKVGNAFEVSARIVDVKSGEIMATASEKFGSEHDMSAACDKIAARFKGEIESERESEMATKNSGNRRFAVDLSFSGMLPVADLAPALSLGGGALLSGRFAIYSRSKYTLPLRFTTGGLAHFGRSSYGNALTFLTVPILLGTGLEWSPFFFPKLVAELLVSGGAAISYLKSNSLNNDYISSDPALQATLGVQYRLSPRYYLRANASYLWVMYAGTDLMSAGFNLGIGVNL